MLRVAITEIYISATAWTGGAGAGVGETIPVDESSEEAVADVAD